MSGKALEAREEWNFTVNKDSVCFQRHSPLARQKLSHNAFVLSISWLREILTEILAFYGIEMDNLAMDIEDVALSIILLHGGLSIRVRG